MIQIILMSTTWLFIAILTEVFGTAMLPKPDIFGDSPQPYFVR